MYEHSIKKPAKNVLEKVMRKTWKNMKNGAKKGAKINENPLKNHPKNDVEIWCVKMLTRAQSGDLPRRQGEYKFNKTPTEVTYSKLTNSKKPNKGGQHLEKKQRGANILEVKYQKVTYRGYFTEVKYQKDDLQKVFYWGKVLKGRAQRRQS